ncbi:hypothetical protein STAL104432_09530 [Streptomyces albus]
MTGSPVRVEMIGSCGRAWGTEPASRANSSSMGPIRAEWKAWLVSSHRPWRSTSRAATVSTASRSPESTTWPGAFTAATETPSTSSGVTSSSEARTAHIAPPDGSAAINRARAATRRHASGRVNTPATCAAANSPTECPVRQSGVTPHDSSSRNSATSMANRAGWAQPVPDSSPSGSVNITSRSGRSSSPSKPAHTSSSAAANTGKVSASSRPIPTR